MKLSAPPPARVLCPCMLEEPIHRSYIKETYRVLLFFNRQPDCSRRRIAAACQPEWPYLLKCP